MSKTYIAKFNGKIVGKRTTKDRTYTHAVYVVPSMEWHLRQALQYTATKTDRANYSWYCAIAEGRIEQKSQDEVIAASMKIDGGFDAYVERVKARAVQIAETRDYTGGIVTWCGRRDLAEKAKRQFQHPWNLLVEIVEAEQIK